MHDRVKVHMNFQGVTVEANNLIFKVKAVLGFEITHPDGSEAKIR